MNTITFSNERQYPSEILSKIQVSERKEGNTYNQIQDVSKRILATKIQEVKI